MSWKITSLYFFSSNNLYFGHKEPIKTKKCFDFRVLGSKFVKFLISILKRQASSFLIFVSFFIVMTHNSSVNWFSGYGSFENVNQHKICFPTEYNMTCFVSKKFHLYQLLTSLITWPKIVAPLKFWIKTLKKTTIPNFMHLTQLAVSFPLRPLLLRTLE